MIELWTDGGCSPNPGLGSWAYVLVGSEGSYSQGCGAVNATTNNAMELRAVIEGIKMTVPGTQLIVHTDSQYVKKGITEWMPLWVKQGWRRKEGKLKNVELWMQLYELSQQREISWNWVRGHAGNEMNERCHNLATQARIDAEQEQGF